MMALCTGPQLWDGCNALAAFAKSPDKNLLCAVMAPVWAPSLCTPVTWSCSHINILGPGPFAEEDRIDRSRPCKLPCWQDLTSSLGPQLPD